MRDAVNCPAQGKYAFMVANTGPLINTFGDLFEDSAQRENAKMELINAIDSNNGDLINIYGYPFVVSLGCSEKSLTQQQIAPDGSVSSVICLSKSSSMPISFRK